MTRIDAVLGCVAWHLQLLWFIGSTLCRPRKSAAADIIGDDGEPKPAPLSPTDSDDNTMLADLGGCGSKLFNTLRQELHALLEAVSMQVRSWLL